MSLDLNLLSELKRGRSKVSDFWIKHPTIEDEAELEFLNSKYLSLAQKRKIPLEKDCVIRAKKDGSWTDSDQNNLDSNVAYLVRLRESYEKIIDSLKKDLLSELTAINTKVGLLKHRRSNAIGKTAEDWAAKISNEKYILNLFYKDKDLKEKAWTEEESDFLEIEEVGLIFGYFLSYREKFCDDSLKSLACNEFSQNLYYISGSCFSFFGKPIIEMTCLQQRFCLFLENYKNIISNINGKVPQSVISDWKELEKWSRSSEVGKEELEKNWSGFGQSASKINYENIKKASLVEGEGKTKAIQDLLV